MTKKLHFLLSLAHVGMVKRSLFSFDEGYSRNMSCDFDIYLFIDEETTFILDLIF